MKMRSQSPLGRSKTIRNTNDTDRIQKIIAEARNIIKSKNPPDRGHLFTDKLKNLRQKFAAKYDVDLSGLESLIKALDEYFRGKCYTCCAYFDDQYVWGSHPEDQNEKDISQCIFSWGDAIPDILEENALYRITGMYKGIQLSLKAIVRYIVNKAEQHSGHTPDDWEKTERDVAVQLLFMVLCRQLQCRHPELGMKFSVYAGENRKIKLTASKNIKKTPKQEVRSAVKQIQQASPELQKAKKPKTRRSKSK